MPSFSPRVADEHAMQTVTGYVEDRMSLVEMKTLDAGCTYQLLEIPAFLGMPSLMEQPPAFVLNVS